MSDTTADQNLPDAQAEHYAITVKGYLDPCWSEWFEGLAMAYTESGETILSGPVPDQAALHGLLTRIRDLNLTLIAVNRVGLEPYAKRCCK